MQSGLLKAVKKSGDNFMTIKLKAEPCNCGSIPEIRDAWTYVDFPAKTAPGFQVVCPVCKTQSIIRGTKNAAIKDWNHGRLSGESTKAHIMRVLDSLRKEVKYKESGNWMVKQ